MGNTYKLFLIIVTVVMFFVSYKFGLNKQSELNAFFNSGETLVCYDTLIVSNSNWKLADNHLINNISAGYLSIDKCRKEY